MPEPFWSQFLRPATLDPRYDPHRDLQRRVHDAVLNRFKRDWKEHGAPPGILALASVFAVVAQCQADFEDYAAQAHAGPASDQVNRARDAFAAAFAATDVYIYTIESADPNGRINPIVELGPSGYRRLWDSELRAFGIVNDIKMNDANSGLYSALYCKGSPRTAGAKYILASRGSDDSNDTFANALQNFGLPAKQYQQAVDAARAITAVVDQTHGSIIYAGHSLGGGLAALQAQVFLRKGYTFQAAGLSSLTMIQHGAVRDNVEQYVTTFDYHGDWLDYLQESGGALLPGGRKVQLPPVTLPAGAQNDTANDRHLMNFVAPAMLKMLKAGNWP